MDIVTDLTAEAVSYLTLFQDILRAQQSSKILETLDKKNWNDLNIDDITVDDDDLTRQQMNKMKDLVWHSPTREFEVSIPDQYFKITLGLLSWISGITLSKSNANEVKVGGHVTRRWRNPERVILCPPFFWRVQIRSSLYSHPKKRLPLAENLHYMPLQIVQVLADGENSAYKIRLYQYYSSRNAPHDDLDILSSEDKELYHSWWHGKRKEAECLLCDDEQLLTKLKKVELPLPFETFFRDELIEITKARQARKTEMEASLNGGKPIGWDHNPGKATAESSFDPTAKAQSMQLIGIALSGGGIRSATFNLGIIQRLASLNVLQHFDYISTVSGGGYIGTWLNSWIKRSGSFSKINDRLCPEKSADPLADEVRPIRWLRMFSNYLTPDAGVMSADAWTSGMTWLRNALINQFVLLLILVTILSVISDLFLLWKWLKELMSNLPEISNIWAFGATFFLLIIGVSLASFAMRSFYIPEKPEKWSQLLKIIESQKLSWALITYLKTNIPMLIVAWGGICAIIVSTYFAAKLEPPINLHTQLEIFGSIGLAALAALLILAAHGNYHKRLDLLQHGRNTVVRPKPYASKYRKWPTLIGIVGSSIVAAATFTFLLSLCWRYSLPAGEYLERKRFDVEKMTLVTGVPVILEIFSVSVIVRMALMGSLFPDYRREWWGRLGGIVHRVVLIWILVSFACLIVPDLWSRAYSIAIPAWGGWAAIIGWGVKKAYESRDQIQKNGKFEKTLLKIVPFFFMIGFLLIGTWVLRQIKTLQVNLSETDNLGPSLIITCTLALLTYIFSWRVGVNEFSLHHFYRNRLIRAYMGATRTREERVKTANAFTGFDTNDDIILSSMVVDDGYIGPFPLINTTLNSTVVFALDRQDRKAESFVFSPLYCGYDFSPTRSSTYNIEHNYEYGFRPTTQFSNENGGPTMGTAMAISGAAVNPNQGHNSSATLAFLLTIFNVRLGWWIGNPRLSKWKRADPGYGMIYLLRDLIGKSDIDMNYVCLSDGGHFDNMGLYELVRRRCSYILIGDGEQDTDGTCEGLANAIRRCRIDFGVEINIDLTPITNKEKNKCSKHSVKGEIIYPNSTEKGTLIYIKAVVIGDEPVDIREYSLVNKDFPQQSTSDQFFDEAQFESYRKLGYHSIKDIRELKLP